MVVLAMNTLMYRVGTANQPWGQYFQFDKPRSVLQTRIDKAILPQWPGRQSSTIDMVFTFRVPAGTRIYVGQVGAQHGMYVGGTEQIVVPKPWDIADIEIVNAEPIT